MEQSEPFAHFEPQEAADSTPDCHQDMISHPVHPGNDSAPSRPFIEVLSQLLRNRILNKS
jgi:hypothetical protein